MFTTGDRVRLVRMDDDPDPIPVGTEGVVEDCRKVMLPSAAGPPFYWQVTVTWDNGRRLQAVCPPDELSVVG